MQRVYKLSTVGNANFNLKNNCLQKKINYFYLRINLLISEYKNILIVIWQNLILLIVTILMFYSQLPLLFNLKDTHRIS